MQLCEANGPYTSIAIIPKIGSPIAIVHGLLEGVVRQTDSVADLRVYYEEGEEQPYVDMAVRALEDLNLAKRSIAIELGKGHPADPKMGMPLNDFLRIKEKLPEAKFVDGSSILRTMRMTKSDEEIACIRRSADIVTETFRDCFGMMKEGMSEPEVVSICNRLVSQKGGRPVWTLAKCGPGEKVLLPRPDSRLKRDRILFLDLGVTFDGYHADFNRMAVVGKASASKKRKCQLIAEITRETLRSVKPGIRACDVVDTCRSQFKRLGLEPAPGIVSPNRIGHGMGLTLTEAPAIATYDKTVLGKGVTFCLEPAIWTEDGYFITEQDVAVTDDGCEVLSKADDGLYEIL